MHARTVRMKTAKRLFMETATNCITCRSIRDLTPSHLFKVNALYKQNNPCDLNLIVCQCLKCHREYELLSVEKRIEYWKAKGFTEIAIRMEKVVGGIYESRMG